MTVVCFDETTSTTELQTLLTKARQNGTIIPIAELVLELCRRGEVHHRLTHQEKLLFGLAIKHARERKKNPQGGVDRRGFDLARLLYIAKNLHVPFKLNNYDISMIKGAVRRAQKPSVLRKTDQVPAHKTLCMYAQCLAIPLGKAA